MWQVQIFVSEVGEWYGWGHTDYDNTDKRSVKAAERVARKYGWDTRIVKIG